MSARIQAGWTTFRFTNEADVTHFMVLQRLPEQAGAITREEYINQVSKTAQECLNLLFAGKRDGAFKKLGEAPDWLIDPGPAADRKVEITTAEGGGNEVSSSRLPSEDRLAPDPPLVSPRVGAQRW